MNRVDCFVTKILSKPYYKYDHWWIRVKANCMGGEIEHDLMLNSEAECLAVEIGYKFLA